MIIFLMTFKTFLVLVWLTCAVLTVSSISNGSGAGIILFGVPTLIGALPVVFFTLRGVLRGVANVLDGR